MKFDYLEGSVQTKADVVKLFNSAFEMTNDIEEAMKFENIKKENFVFQTDESGQTLLEKSMPYPKVFSQMLSLIDENHRSEILESNTSKGTSYLQEASVHYPDTLAVIIDLIPNKEKTSVLSIPDDNGVLLISHCLNNPEIMKNIVNTVDKESLSELLFSEDLNGIKPIDQLISNQNKDVIDTVLNTVVSDKAMTNFVSNDSKFETIKLAVSDPKTLDIIFSHMDNESLKNVFENKSQTNEILFESAMFSTSHILEKHASRVGVDLNAVSAFDKTHDTRFQNAHSVSKTNQQQIYH